MRMQKPCGEVGWTRGLGTRRMRGRWPGERAEVAGGLAAKLLYLRTKNGHTYVDYRGSHLTTDRTPNALVQAGDSGIQTYIAGIIDSKKTVEYHIADSFSTQYLTNVSTAGGRCGGACTVGAEESLTGNTQIFVNRDSSGIAEGV